MGCWAGGRSEGEGAPPSSWEGAAAAGGLAAGSGGSAASACEGAEGQIGAVFWGPIRLPRWNQAAAKPTGGARQRTLQGRPCWVQAAHWRCTRSAAAPASHAASASAGTCLAVLPRLGACRGSPAGAHPVARGAQAPGEAVQSQGAHRLHRALDTCPMHLAACRLRNSAPRRVASNRDAALPRQLQGFPLKTVRCLGVRQSSKKK